MQVSEKNAPSSLTTVISRFWLTFSPCGHLALDGPHGGFSLRGAIVGESDRETTQAPDPLPGTLTGRNYSKESVT